MSGPERHERPEETTVDRYDAREAEQRWRPVWENLDPFAARDDGSAPRKYALTMFSYPSGDLHMGHGEVFALHDVISRYWFSRGYDVLNPIGWDSFGLPAENAAIRRNENPASWTYANIETQAESIRRYGMSFDWSRRLHTSDPEYYRWTQWLFLRFFERGLAYRKASWVNWCPHDQTVLANEQVVGGLCERCGTRVTKRELTQWYFRITDYAQRLLDDMAQLEGQWPDRVLTMQRNWIGRSEGAWVDFAVEGRAEPVRVFTTRPDTLFGATFMVVAPDSALAEEICTVEQRAEFEAYREATKQTSDIERQSTERPKTGVSLGAWAVNPVSGERIPVWTADYVLAEYGTGAVMAVPAHDQRDLDFARAFGLPVRRVVDTGEPNPEETGVATTGDGTYVSSGELDGLTDKATGVATITRTLVGAGAGESAVTFRLRDWLLSRQRYWGAPIPIVHCPQHGEVAVPDDQLPVQLPDLRGADLAPRGVSPLAAATDWVQTTCPECGGPATRDTDTMDTFVDSSWYFLRYTSPGDTERPFDPEAVRRWMPADIYFGGVEHAVLHLLYFRFFTKVLHDLGMVDFVEPARVLINQGQVVNHGASMSKSLGNGVDLGAQLDEFGVDAVRLTMVFAGPPEDDIDWADVSPAGSLRFLQRAWRLAHEVTSAPGTDPSTGDAALRRQTHRTIADAQMLIESHRFNVMIARVMELVNATRKAIDTGPGGSDPAVREAVEVVAKLLGLVAPYAAEDMWAALGHEPTIGVAPWPAVDRALLIQDTVVCVVSVNGKVRARVDVEPDIGEGELAALVEATPDVVRALDGLTVRRTIVRAPKLVNYVVG